MRIPRVVVLLVLVAAVGAWIWLRELPKAEQEGKKEKLLAVDKDAVTGITLTYPDREIELRKGDDGWRVTKPGNAPADDAAVKALLATLTDADVQRTLDQLPQNLAEFGLDKPVVTARLTMKDGTQSPSVTVGKNTSIGAKTYVRRGDEPKLQLTASSVAFGLTKQPKDLRDKTLVTFQDDDVRQVEIRGIDGSTTTLARKDKDAWTVDPGGHPADATEVRSYLSSLRAARATDFPDDSPTDLARYGLDTPRLTVTVTTGQEGAQVKRSVLLGKEATEGTQRLVYAKRGDQPIVYALGDWSVRTLGKAAAQFRDKTVLGFDPARVGTLALTRPGGPTLTLARKDGGWRFEGADAETVDTDTVTRFLDDLRDLRGSDIAAEPPGDLAAFGLAAPALRIALTDKDGQAMGVVLAAKHDGKYYALREGGGTVFDVRDYMYTRLEKTRAAFLRAAGGPTTTVPAMHLEDADDDGGGELLEEEQGLEAAPDEGG